MRKILLSFTILFLLAGFSACSPTQNNHKQEHIAVGISADFDHLNPLLIQLSLSREVCTLIYPTLVKPSYNEQQGVIEYLPSAAAGWQFSDDGMQATFNLKPDAVWEDGTPLTSHDFAFAYRLYAEPAVASTRQHYLDDLPKKADGSIDFERGIQTPDDHTLVLMFRRSLAPDIILDHFNDLMPVAKHIFKDIPPDEIRTRAAELPIIGAGPFKVSQWARQQKLVLESNPASTLPHPAAVRYMSFIIVPEYTTRLTMLKSGQLDALISAGGINPKDAEELANTNPDITIRPVKDRYFDSVVWLNIDGEHYRRTGNIKPHALFGDPAVRRAMTCAIDRQSIIDGFMGPEHAEIVNTSLSPAYAALAYIPKEDKYAYNPEKAVELLASAGWVPGPDGILQKNGTRFSFSLAAPVGNPRRNYAATIIQQNLRDIGIDCNLSIDENLIFLKSQNEFRYDAALSGLAAETLPFQLIIWGSDFENRPFNSSAFRNTELDSVIARLSGPQPQQQRLDDWLRYQEILYHYQPRTFLYYYDELEGFSDRVENVEVNLLSTLYNAHEWTLRK